MTDFDNTLITVTQRFFSVKFVEVLGSEDRRLVYCDFIKPGGDRGYVERPRSSGCGAVVPRI